MARSRWADEDDDSSVEEEKISTNDAPPTSTGGGKTSSGVTIPPTHTSRVDSKGIKIVTSYRAHPTDPNRLLKTTTKIRVYTDKVRESTDVAKRRKWKKFGQAAVDEDV
mmetsp:Transcript_47314/g.71582  ORF Transcript_47314/g.71582 Transcript_47314/m.71582 type:complete len:109 (+) Transcript_47314:210-536(+)